MNIEKYNFNEGPRKTHVDAFVYTFSDGAVHLAFGSGKEEFTFTMNPALAKALGRGVSQLVQKIETDNKVVFESRLTSEPMKSPLGLDDLKGGKGESGNQK